MKNEKMDCNFNERETVNLIINEEIKFNYINKNYKVMKKIIENLIK